MTSHASDTHPTTTRIVAGWASTFGSLSSTRTRGKPKYRTRRSVIAFTTNKRTEASSRVASRTGDLISPVYLYLPRSFRGARPRQERRAVATYPQVTRGAPLERWWPSALEPWLYTSTPDLDTIPRHPDTPTPVSIDTRSDTSTPESVRPVSSHQCQAVSMVSKLLKSCEVPQLFWRNRVF